MSWHFGQLAVRRAHPAREMLSTGSQNNAMNVSGEMIYSTNCGLLLRTDNKNVFVKLIEQTRGSFVTFINYITLSQFLDNKFDLFQNKNSQIIKTNKCTNVLYYSKTFKPVRLPPCNKNDVHKHDMLPHHFNEVFTDYFNILHTSARNYMCSLMMIDRSKHVGAF
jgi:hypothetical protein